MTTWMGGMAWMPILFWVLVILVIVALIKYLFGRGR